MKKITILPLLALILYSCNEDEIRENQNCQLIQNQSVDFSVKALYSTNHKVSAKEAESQLMNLFNASNNGLKSTSGKTIKQTTAILRTSGLKSTNGDTLAYAFNFSDNGYAICSADDRTPESVLAIIDNGSFEENSKNENYALISNKIENYIDYSIDNFETNKTLYLSIANSKMRGVQLKSITHPFIVGYQRNLLQTEWNQYAPYNNDLGLCGTYNNNGCKNKVATGCLPLAIAQVLHYWQLGRYHRGINLSDDEISRYVGSISKSIVTVINGKQRYGCGQNNHPASSSFECDAETYLKGKGIKYDYFYNSNDFTYEKIKTHLDKKLPLVISAGGITADEEKYGHAWVIDGYLHYKFSTNGLTNTYNLVHCNWGWGGYCNGYFSYNVLNPAKGLAYDNNNHDEANKKYNFTSISGIFVINPDGDNKVRLYVGSNSESDEAIDVYENFKVENIRGLLGCVYKEPVANTYPFCKYKKNGKYIYCIEKGTNSKGNKILKNCSTFTSEGFEFVKCLGYVYDNVGDGLTAICEYRNKSDNSYHGVSYSYDKYLLNKNTYEVTYFAALCRVY